MREITVEELLELHRLGHLHYGGSNIVPSDAQGRLQSVLYTARYQVLDDDNVLAYAAAILAYIARAQHFVDGNKRLAWSGAMRALEVNGFSVHVAAQDAEEYIKQLIDNKDITIGEIADWLADRLVEVPS
jgi:prophage maintenance system killer protein